MERTSSRRIKYRDAYTKNQRKLNEQPHQHQQDRFLTRGKFETVMASTILLKEKDMRFSFKRIWANTRSALTVLVWREEGVGPPRLIGRYGCPDEWSISKIPWAGNLSG